MSDGNPTGNPTGDPTGFSAGTGDQVLPGWYPDPTTGQPRWWDGAQWGPYQQPPPMPMRPAQVSDPRSTAALAHYLGLIGFLGPLIIFCTSGNNDPFVRDQSAEALNFHLSVIIGWLIVMVIGIVTCGIGLLLAFPLWIGEIIFSIMGGIAASRGEWYRYPINIRMIKP